MPKPFSYFQYQQEPYFPSGRPFVPGITFFTGSGYYFPPNLVVGGAAGFVWNLVEDDSLRLRPIQFRTRTSGKVTDGNNDASVMQLGVSGNVFPLLGDSGNLDFSFTGIQTGYAYDLYTFDVVFTGSVSGTPLDSGDFNVSFTGTYLSGFNDKYDFNSSFSGKQASGFIDIALLQVGFSGNLVRKDKDTATIDFVFSQVSYNGGTATITIESGDNASVNLIFSSVSYRSNGG